MRDKRQNVLWIMTDQHRAQALGINGDPNVHTPNLDYLSRTGLLFTDAIGGFPLHCPLRGSLLTGLYFQECDPVNPGKLSFLQKTIAHILNEHNYDTFYLGKWQSDECCEKLDRAAAYKVHPQARSGFITWIGYENSISQWDTWVHGESGTLAVDYRLLGHETDVLTDMMIEYIDKQGENKRKKMDEPFFAVLSVQAPHHPLITGTQTIEKHNAANIVLRPNVPEIKRIRDQASEDLAGYYTQIENIDENIGRLWEALHRNDLLFDTHIIFFSDHGDMLGSHGMFGNAAPMEESIRIPFIIAGERPFAHDRRSSGKLPGVLVNHMDIVATTLGLCGIMVPPWMRGVDYSHYRIQDNPVYEEPDSTILLYMASAHHPDRIDKPWRGIVTKDGYKYASFENHEWLLFNLNDDPYEEMNLCHNPRYWPRLRELNEKLRQWINKSGDTFTLPKI